MSSSVFIFHTRCGIWSTKTVVKAHHVVQAFSHYRHQNKQRICGVFSTHMDPELGHYALIISFTAPYWPNPEQTSHLMWPMREQLMLCSAWGRITGTESGVMLHVPSGVSEQPWGKKKWLKLISCYITSSGVARSQRDRSFLCLTWKYIRHFKNEKWFYTTVV